MERETRTVDETKIYTLVLNDMRSTNIEIGTLTKHIAYSKQDMVAFIRGEAGSWKDGNWGKSFKKGSELEWFNGLANAEERDTFGHGINWQWISDTTLEELLAQGKVEVVPEIEAEK